MPLRTQKGDHPGDGAEKSRREHLNEGEGPRGGIPLIGKPMAWVPHVAPHALPGGTREGGKESSASLLTANHCHSRLAFT